MKVLHLIVDHQVIERTLGIYEKVFPQSNDVLVFKWRPKDPIKHLTTHKYNTMVDNGCGLEFGRNHDFSGITHIIAHYMTMDMIDFIKSAPQNIHVCWEIYGADLYNQFLQDYGYKIYYTSPTKYSKYRILETYFNPFYKTLLFLKGVKYIFSYQRKQQFEYITHRVDSLQYCCKGDGYLVNKISGRSIPGYEVFNYSLTEVLGDLVNHEFFEGNNIMVGNSASFSNNHFYVLHYLKDIDLKDGSTIVMPLSYGGGNKYINSVIKSYKKFFGPQLSYIRDYMPLKEYNMIFLSMKAMIMSAWRQESIGTIIMGLYLGIKVYMSEKSPLYSFLKECGFIIYTVESINNENLMLGLTTKQKQKNRDLVISRYQNQIFENNLKNNIL